MQVNPYIFRGYDLRGIAGKDLTPEIVEHLGRGYGTFLIRHNLGRQAIVAYDCRLTSEEYKNALIKGITATGVNVVDIGLTMVGAFYWAQYFLNIRDGAMITASHNSSEYNGFKFAVNFSETMVSEQIQELRQIVEKEEYVVGEKIGVVENRNIQAEYFSDLIKRFGAAKKYKVVVDPGNSTAGAFVPELLRQAGYEVIEKNCNLDGHFPLGTPDPTEKIVAERLAEEVLEANADIGFSYDADGDRIGIVDEKGGIIWNDVLVAIFAADVLEKHPGATIMYNTLCSKIVEDVIKSKGGAPFMWRTGHSFLKKKNQEIKAAFIGELSGHFFFSEDFYNHDDGCYTTLRLLDYLSRTGQSLSEAVSKLPKYISSPEVKLGCADDLKVALIGKISQVLKKDFPDAEVIDDERAGDGVRLNLADGMLVVRYSQNGPYLTIKFEGRTEEKYAELKKYLGQLLHNYPEINLSEGVNVDALK
ncbi:MAG: phosphomannomutase/phosphoglucomutase [Candidatus Moranbacteria bacterium]|nr:phosphomannomutase/phosphoglucomutase [Candidatus Moranbacteria bacterium]